jgi:hypothetical protein
MKIYAYLTLADDVGKHTEGVTERKQFQDQAHRDG